VDPSAVGVLKGLISVPWIAVAFLIDGGGRVLASVGSHPAFSPSGEFREGAPETVVDPDTCVYMTAISRNVYLGVLFSSEVPIEEVRAEVGRVEGSLAAAVGG
jgi:hypothetical protein